MLLQNGKRFTNLTFMQNNTVPILYSAGAYGTFVEWCLYYFAGKIGSDLPFTSTGSAHRYKGNQLFGINDWRLYCRNPQHEIIRTHLKLSKTDSIINNIQEIADGVGRAILLHPTASTTLLTINNKYEKVWGIGWLKAMNHVFEHRLQGWGSKNVDDLERWQLRDFLSTYLMDEFRIDTDLERVLEYSHPNLIKVSVDQLLHNFEPTIRQLLAVCGFPIQRTNFDEVYREWISRQIHISKDQLVADIVEHVAADREYEWAGLTLVDEAFVQMQLRDLHHQELKCYNLNEFPATTRELRKYLTNE